MNLGLVSMHSVLNDYGIHTLITVSRCFMMIAEISLHTVHPPSPCSTSKNCQKEVMIEVYNLTMHQKRVYSSLYLAATLFLCFSVSPSACLLPCEVPENGRKATEKRRKYGNSDVILRNCCLFLILSAMS